MCLALLDKCLESCEKIRGGSRKGGDPVMQRPVSLWGGEDSKEAGPVKDEQLNVLFVVIHLNVREIGMLLRWVWLKLAQW